MKNIAKNHKNLLCVLLVVCLMASLIFAVCISATAETVLPNEGRGFDASDDLALEKKLDALGWQIDAVFTHTCPYRYIPREAFMSCVDQSTVDNSTEIWLDSIEGKLNYNAWYCGHWHIDKRIDKMHFLFESVETTPKTNF